MEATGIGVLEAIYFKIENTYEKSQEAQKSVEWIKFRIDILSNFVVSLENFRKYPLRYEMKFSDPLGQLSLRGRWNICGCP